ncbi:MAG: hypothetical protein CMA35_00490 [Euryarchaeota archaeon]|nr:hypothetical protein [Euryarchaeota archaeon]RPG77122.1 MAG: hypothetical protein CBC77_005820 [Euryarchaeota archaeon TMED117]|tara:strand:+ start:6690 stop:9542 length:2853 start_codon:yes stop_codon:yes gene_type:complete
MGVPLDNAEQSTFSETEIVSSVGENLEDYELFLDSVDGDDAITTIQPEGNQIEASLLGTGIQFESEEMISDLTVKGKSNDEVKILVFLKWRASQNTSTAEASFKLYSGSDLVEQVTEDLGDPQSAGLFGGSDSWQPYTILLDVGSSGFVVENGDRLKLDIEATASCEGGGDGSPFGGSTCEVDIAYGGTVGNEYSRLELRANALSGSQVKVHYQGEGWSEVEVTEWSPTHRIEKRTMQFSVDVRDAFGREDIEKIELVLSTPNNANTVFEKEFTDSDLKLDNDGLVGNYSFTYDSGITPGLYPLTMVITDVQGHSINYEHPLGMTFLEHDIYLDFPSNQIGRLLVAPGQISTIELSLEHTGSLTSDLTVQLELQQSLPSGWSDPIWSNPGGYTLNGGGSSVRPELTVEVPEDLSGINENYQIVVEARAYVSNGAGSTVEVRLVSLEIDVEKVNQFGEPDIEVYEDVEQQIQIYDSDRLDFYNENLSHYVDYDEIGDFYLKITNVGFDDDTYRLRIQEIPVAWSVKFLINGTGTELTEQGIDSLTPTVGQGEILMIRVEVYPPLERDAVDIGLLRFTVTSDGSTEETLSTSVGWTIHRTFGILAEVISDSDAGTLGTVGPVSPGSTVVYNVRITDSSENAGTTNWVIKNPSAVQRNIDEDPGYATWMYDVTDVEGNIALVASLTGGQYVDIKVEMTVRQQVEAGLHTIYMQVAEESDGIDEPRYFDLPLTVEISSEVEPGRLAVEQKTQATRIGAGETLDVEYRIENQNNVELNVIITLDTPEGWDGSLDGGEFISLSLPAFSTEDFTLEITAPKNVKNGQLVDFQMTVVPMDEENPYPCNAEICYTQEPTFSFKTESSGIVNAILSELSDPEPTTMVMFLSILVLLGFGLYRRGQNKMKAQLYASMVEPTEEVETEPEFDWDDIESSSSIDESSEVELELVEVETEEDSL